MINLRISFIQFLIITIGHTYLRVFMENNTLNPLYSNSLDLQLGTICAHSEGKLPVHYYRQTEHSNS